MLTRWSFYKKKIAQKVTSRTAINSMSIDFINSFQCKSHRNFLLFAWLKYLKLKINLSLPQKFVKSLRRTSIENHSKFYSLFTGVVRIAYSIQNQIFLILLILIVFQALRPEENTFQTQTFKKYNFVIQIPSGWNSFTNYNPKANNPVFVSKNKSGSIVYSVRIRKNKNYSEKKFHSEIFKQLKIQPIKSGANLPFRLPHLNKFNPSIFKSSLTKNNLKNAYLIIANDGINVFIAMIEYSPKELNDMEIEKILEKFKIISNWSEICCKECVNYLKGKEECSRFVESSQCIEYFEYNHKTADECK